MNKLLKTLVSATAVFALSVGTVFAQEGIGMYVKGELGVLILGSGD